MGSSSSFSPRAEQGRAAQPRPGRQRREAKVRNSGRLSPLRCASAYTATTAQRMGRPTSPRPARGLTLRKASRRRLSRDDALPPADATIHVATRAGLTAASPRSRSAASAPTSIARWGRLPGPLPGRAELPLCVPRRHLLQGPGQPPRDLPGGGGGHRGVRRCRREVLGLAAGDSEDGAFWTAFLRSLKARGLTGCSWSSPTPHLGLRHAVQAVLAGAAMQRCRACTFCATCWPGSPRARPRPPPGSRQW